MNLFNGNLEKVTIRIFDMTGRLLESNIINSIDINSKKLGANLPSGLYNVLVSQGDLSKSIRVIKN